jgi:hypothetical protein
MSTLAQEQPYNQDDKALHTTHSHHEGALSKPEAMVDQPLLVSAFASDTKVQIMRKFWRLYAFGLAVSLGGMYAGTLQSLALILAYIQGYCSNAVGNIVANPGEYP